MASVKKIIKDAWLGKRYSAIEGKENCAYNGTPGPTTRRASEPNMNSGRHYLRRNTSATQSIRDAVGVFRQVQLNFYSAYLDATLQPR